MHATMCVVIVIMALSAAANVAPPAWGQEQKSPLKIVSGGEPGVRMEILGLSRDEGGMLTLRVALVTESGGEVKNSVLPGKGNVENFALLD